MLIELSVQTCLSFMLLGAVVGFMAGLLGIGGGGIMVPVLTSLLLAHNVPLGEVVHIALGTSMASIITTSAASMVAHHQHQGVLWPLVKKITPGVLLGTFLATYWVSILEAEFLAIFFSVFMAYVSIQMFLNLESLENYLVAQCRSLIITQDHVRSDFLLKYEFSELTELQLLYQKLILIEGIKKI